MAQIKTKQGLWVGLITDEIKDLLIEPEKKEEEKPAAKKKAAKKPKK